MSATLVPTWKALARSIMERPELLTEAEMRFVRATAFQGHRPSKLSLQRLQELAARTGVQK
jgi:hypothetical protein